MPRPKRSRKFSSMFETLGSHQCRYCKRSFLHKTEWERHEQAGGQQCSSNFDADLTDPPLYDTPSNGSDRNPDTAHSMHIRDNIQDPFSAGPVPSSSQRNDSQNPLNAISTLYRDRKYPPELDLNSDWFPFDSKADAIIYLWDAPCKSNRLPEDRLTLLLQALVLLDVKGITCKKGQTFRTKYDDRFPLMDIHYASAMKSSRHRQKSKKKNGKSTKQDDVDPETSVHPPSQVQVPFFCPDEYVIRTMADPLWGPNLRFGVEDVPRTQKITQFNQTPFAKEILKWSQLRFIDRITHQNESRPVEVGHWYEIDQDDRKNCYALVDALYYKGGHIDIDDIASDSWWPDLYARVRLCDLKINRRSRIRQSELKYTANVIDVTVKVLGYKLNVFRGNRTQLFQLDANDRTEYDAYLSAAWNELDTPKIPTYQYPEVIRGDPFFFLSWFIDSFKATKSGKQSVDGVYQSILNLDSKYRNTGETHKTLALIESGVDIGQVMRAITGSSKLRKGFKVQGLEVKGTLALAPADLHQLSAQCRHGGSSSTRNCPNCTVTIEDRTKTTINITDFDVTRTRAQTDEIVKMCQEFLRSEQRDQEQRVAKSKIDDVRREFSVKLEQSWYDGWDFDEHRQGFREPEHLFYYGIFRLQLSYLTDQMQRPQRDLFIARVDSFDWPPGMPQLSFDFNPKRGKKKKWGTDVSMAMYKQLFIATLFCADGLLPNNNALYKHFCEMWLWHIEVLDTHISVDDIPSLQERGLRIMQTGCTLMKSVYDRPNGHGVIELIIRTLPALVYLNLVKAGTFERHHQLTKRTNPSRFFIVNAMKSFNVRDTLQLLCHGTRWGPSQQYILGIGIRELKDPTKTVPCPHALIANITSILPQRYPRPMEYDIYQYSDDWDPLNYSRKKDSTSNCRHTPETKILTGFKAFLSDHNEAINLKHCSWRYPTTMRKWFDDGSHRVVKIGHTIECTGFGDIAFAKVVNIIELRYLPDPKHAGRHRKNRRLSNTHSQQSVPDTPTQKWRMILLQVQWYRNISRVQGTTRNENKTGFIHKLRKTRIMQLDLAPDEALLAPALMVRPVLAVHCCIFGSDIQSHSTHTQIMTPQQRNHICTLDVICPRHGEENCADLSCADRNEDFRRVKHDFNNNFFEIADERHGLYFDFHKQLKFTNLNNDD